MTNNFAISRPLSSIPGSSPCDKIASHGPVSACILSCTYHMSPNSGITLFNTFFISKSLNSGKCDERLLILWVMSTILPADKLIKEIITTLMMLSLKRHDFNRSMLVSLGYLGVNAELIQTLCAPSNGTSVKKIDSASVSKDLLSMV